ncbi:MAG: hypothetical protein AAFZ14_13470, partial [Pseudomonadota bacterium]
GTEATFALAFEGERITEVSLVQPVAGPSDPFDIGLHLDGLRKRAEMTRLDNGPLSLASSFEAGARIGTVQVALRLEPQSDKTLRATFDLEGVSLTLAEVAHLTGTDPVPPGDLRWLPEELRQTDALTLIKLELLLEPSLKKPIKRVEVDVQLGPGVWQPIPELPFPRLTDVIAQLEVDHPLEPGLRFAEVSLRGQVEAQAPGPGEVTGRGLALEAKWPDLRIHGTLAQGLPLDLIALAGKLDIPTAMLPQSAADRLLLTQLDVSARPTGKVRQFAVVATVAPAPATRKLTHWSIPVGPHKHLALRDMRLSYAWDSVAGTSAAIFARGAFTSQPATADSTLDLIAEVHHGHWRISGRWEADPKTPLKLGAWMQDFATGLDPAFQLPKILGGLEVHLFDLTFDSGAQTLSARVEGATGNVELELALSVAPEPTGDWVIHAEGLLTHGTLSFALVFDRAAHKRAMAVLVAEEPVTASLDDIIAVLGGVPGPLPTPSVGFQAALAVFDEDAAGQELRLLAVDLETGVDLTTLPL